MVRLFVVVLSGGSFVLDRNQNCYLRAGALNDVGRSLDAIDVIAKDFMDRFDLLRSDIYWRARDLFKSSRVLALISNRYERAALGNEEVEVLLRRAVALGLAGDKKRRGICTAALRGRDGQITT